MTAEQKLEFAPDCSSNDEFIVAVDDVGHDVSRDAQVQHHDRGGQMQTDNISSMNSVIYETSRLGEWTSTSAISLWWMLIRGVNVDNDT